MTTKKIICCLTLAAVVSVGDAGAAGKDKTHDAAVALTAEGKELEARYAEMLHVERTEIAKSLPQINPAAAAAYRKAYADEAAAQLAYEATYKHQGHEVVVSAQAKADAVKKGKAREQAYAEARLQTIQAAKNIFAGADKILTEGSLDSRLVKCAVLADATPAGLAAFAQQDGARENLVAKLLADPELMRQMLVAGGAKGGQYGRAMEIYAAIQKASPRAASGILQRLALGTALEQAGPGENNGRYNIDPVKRYLHYEKAWLAGELDPAFATMTAWDCRMITDEPNSEEDLAWYREMLKNYRPDHVLNPDYKWRYSRIVRTDVPYREPLPEQHDGTSRIQELLCGGGKCGPRAFVGRIALRSFGIPVWGVQQPGHAALAHWTPAGWTINLGAGWQYSTWENRPGNDFLLEAEARAFPNEFLKSLRAQWLGAALGEKKVEFTEPGSGGFWNALGYTEKEAIVAEGKPVKVELAGEDLAEATESKKAEAIARAQISEQDSKVTVGPNGVITIPAAACTQPQNNTKNVTFMKSFLGGMQLNAGGDEAFEYAVTAPSAGKYDLTARVVTVHKNQKLNLTVAGGARVSLPLPYTVGEWRETQPIKVALNQGENTLRFSGEAKSLSFTIKEFTLKPVN
jgi:hypothetical protein